MFQTLGKVTAKLSEQAASAANSIANSPKIAAQDRQHQQQLQQEHSIKLLQKNAHVLNTETPEPSSLEIDASAAGTPELGPSSRVGTPIPKPSVIGETDATNGVKVEGEGSAESSSGGIATTNGGEDDPKVDGRKSESNDERAGVQSAALESSSLLDISQELPREIVQKLKKFNKYEEKYPCELFGCG